MWSQNAFIEQFRTSRKKPLVEEAFTKVGVPVIGQTSADMMLPHQPYAPWNAMAGSGSKEVFAVPGTRTSASLLSGADSAEWRRRRGGAAIVERRDRFRCSSGVWVGRCRRCRAGLIMCGGTALCPRRGCQRRLHTPWTDLQATL